MISRNNINRIIILGFMVIVGFCFAKAIYSESFIGFTLAAVSLGAGLYFLYLVIQSRKLREEEETA